MTASEKINRRLWVGELVIACVSIGYALASSIVRGTIEQDAKENPTYLTPPGERE